MPGNGLSASSRVLSGAALLALLAVCGYVGAGEKDVQTAAIPVAYSIMTAQEISASAVEDAGRRLDEAREEEIAMLDSVLCDHALDAETHKEALAQKMSLAVRMENEAQLEAMLSYMGYDALRVVCGAESVTVFAPAEMAMDEAVRVRIIDISSSQTGFLPENVKIILAKK